MFKNLLKRFYLLILFSTFFNYSFAQDMNEPVATIGANKISAEEFRYRYELTPQMFLEQKSLTNELKHEFLYTLIAEKLLAMYGESTSLDTSDLVKHSLKYFEEMFVRDALYDFMIVGKAKFKSDSLLGFYLANATTVKCNYIKTGSFEEAERIHSLLKKGVPFDFFYSDSTLKSKDTLAVTFGQFNEAIENEVLTLPEDGFTQPIQFDDEWYILKVAVKYYPVLKRSIGWESEYKRLQKLAKERAEFVFYKEYMKDVFANLNVKANGKLLHVLADEVFDLLGKKKQSKPEQKKYFLEASDIALIGQKINSTTLNQKYFTLPNESAALKDFLYYLRFENLSFDTITAQKVFNVLNGATRKYIEHKVLSNEGYKYGLDKDKRVQEKYNMWKQNYYYQLVLSEFADSANVTDDEIKLYYNKLMRGKFKLEEVKIAQVVTENLDDAEKVLNELGNGADIYELAQKYSVRKTEPKSQNNFKPISSFGELSSVIDKMKIGEVYGPQKVNDGYLIFKLEDLKEDSTFNTASLDQIKKEYGQEIRYLKKKETINRFIAKLASENIVAINEELLKNIRTTRHNAVVFQLLGFGGKLTAVPLISPNSEWVEYWLNNLKLTP